MLWQLLAAVRATNLCCSDEGQEDLRLAHTVAVFACTASRGCTPDYSSNYCAAALPLLQPGLQARLPTFRNARANAVSCSWGYTTTGGAKGVGESTTSAVVISLVLIFVFDFALRWARQHAVACW